MTRETIGRRGFVAADAYDAGRPSYSPAAIARVLRELELDGSSSVLDLAAGTGQVSRALVPHVGKINAVEPSAPMRALLARRVPTATVLDGEAAAIPLPPASVDAVVIGEAFHWFATARVLDEIARVLRPGGGLALLWNVVTETQPKWPAELDRLLTRHRRDAVAEEQRYDSGRWRTVFDHTALFTELDHEASVHEQQLDPEGVVAQVASWSYIASLPDALQSEILAHVRSWAPTRLLVQYRTELYWCNRE